MGDIDIAKSAKLEKISDIAKKIDIDDNNLEQYGKYKAKIDLKIFNELEDKKDAIKTVCKDRKLKKDVVYKQVLDL